MSLLDNEEFVIELAPLQNEEFRIVLSLPVTKEKMEQVLIQLTGKKNGTEYAILDGRCPYFRITRHDEFPLLNKIAEIGTSFDAEKKLLLKNWCDHWQSGGCTDLTEIANAALQIHKMFYIEGIKTFDDLGRALLVASEMDQQLNEIGNLPKVGNNIMDYLDYEAIGRDFDSRGNGTNYPMMEQDRVLGYVLDDSEVDPRMFSKEQVLDLDTQELVKQSHDYLKESLNQVPRRSKNQFRDIGLEK